MLHHPSHVVLSGLIALVAFLPATAPRSLAQTTSNTPPNADSRDTSKPRPRAVTASMNWSPLTWNETEQKTVGVPFKIHFDGPTAPVALLGKPVPPNTVMLTPEVPGVWRWTDSQTLSFEPQGGWMPPRTYDVAFAETAFQPECKVTRGWETNPDQRRAPYLSASFGQRSFYIDPATPALQQTVATVLFNYPVALEEVVRCLAVVNMSETPLFTKGSKPQVIADAKSPLRFFLRSPLIKLGEKEDLVRFEIAAGLTAKVGGDPLRETAVTKLTVPSRYTGFHFDRVRAQLIKNPKGEPRQYVFLESSLGAHGQQIAKQVESWVLPEPEKDENGKVVAWTGDNVSDEVLAKSKRVALEYVPSGTQEPTPQVPEPPTEVFGFRLKPQLPATLFIRVPKNTPAPGGYLTPEDFTAVVNVPGFEKEVAVTGRGGILALNGEHKLHIQSRGYEHLRYTIARVPETEINHFASQTQGRFEAPQFKGGFGFADIAHFSHSIQHIAKANDFQANFSAFDFAAAVKNGEPAAAGEAGKIPRGLFNLVVEGVRPRTEADGKASDGDPDPDWIPLTAAHSSRHHDDDGDNEEEEGSRAASNPFDSRFVLITDLGLIVKRNAGGARDVFVQSFQLQEPIAEVRLTAIARNGDTLAEAVTDNLGHATLPALDGLQREKQPVALVARKGTDLAFIAWERSDRRVETSRFEVGGVHASEASALHAFLFTERGIYRPGDPIQLGVIVRQQDWAGVLTGLPLEVVLINAKEEEAGRFPLKLPADGFISVTMPTTETAPTGVWNIQLMRPSESASKSKRKEEAESLGQILIRVEEFQPDRLKLTAKFDPSQVQAWMSPEKLSAQLDFETLFGIAAADRRVTAKMRISPGTPEFSQWPGWTFGLPADKTFEPKEIDLGETKTDENGHAQIMLGLEDHAAPLLRVNVELEGFEADGGRGVKGALTTLVSRHPYLLGYKASGDVNFIDPKAPPTLELTAIGPDAKPVAAPGLKRVLTEVRHVSVLTRQSNGTMAYVSQRVDKELESVDGSLSAATTSLRLPVKSSGSFRYEWRDTLGTVHLGISFMVAGSGDLTRNMERDSELELTVPDKAWRADEELEISVRAPFAGAGLITIEREKVLVSRWFKSAKATSLQHITVPEGLEGGAYVHVTFVRGLDSPEIFTNPLSTGVVAFRVAEDRRQVAVTLDAPQRVRPGERLTIGYSTAKPARIVIWAVDEGIHRVTNYKAPRPLSDLLNKPALEVDTFQLVDLLLPEFTLLKNALATGGDGEGGAEPPELKAGLNPFKRKRLAPVIFWSGILESGPGRQEIVYQVPDYFAGGINIVAAAVTPEAVGVAQQHSIVKGPFVLTPNAPFFVAPGDEFTASVTVANQLEGAAVTDHISVGAEVAGGLEIVERPDEAVVIAPGKEATLRFRLRAKEALGNAEIKFFAVAGKERVEQRTTMSVRPGTPRTAVVQSGWFRSETHDVKIEHEYHREFAKREAVVSTTPLGLARGLAAYLREFPFGCSEQIASRAFPWLVLRDEASFGLEKAEAADAVNKAIAQLHARQASSGGFGYWSNDNEDGFDYLSVYVTQFLTEARASGFRVPAPMYDAALRRMRLMADAKVSPPTFSDGRWYYDQTRMEANLQAAAIYLITRNEEVTTNYALKLSDFMAASKVPVELWHRDPSAVCLAATWRLLKKEDEAKRLINAHLKARAVPQRRVPWTRYYETPLTEEATTLTMLCRHFPEIAGKFGYDELRPITELIEQGGFNTLSAAWSVQAFKAYAGLAKANGVRAGIAQLSAPGPQNAADPAKTVAEPQAGMISATMSPGVARFFLLQAPGAKMGAWYQTIETGFDHQLPDKPEARTLEVYREILDENEQPVTSAKVGDNLLVKITVRNLGKTAQANVALSELLPGGFDFAPQGEEHALRPGLGTLEGTDYVDVREDRALLFCNLEESATVTFTYAVRPTCAGSFVVPPAYAESMYDRAVHGHGVAGSFTVLPRE